MLVLTNIKTESAKTGHGIPAELYIRGTVDTNEVNQLMKLCACPVKISPALRCCDNNVNSFRVYHKGETVKNANQPLFGGAWYDRNGKLLYITRVLYNKPATIVFWSDGEKTVAKCAKEDTYSAETGLAMAILKKVLGGTTVAKTFTDWLPADEKTKQVDLKDLRAKKRKTKKESE